MRSQGNKTPLIGHFYKGSKSEPVKHGGGNNVLHGMITLQYRSVVCDLMNEAMLQNIPILIA